MPFNVKLGTKQRGYFNLDGWGSVLLACAVACGIVGWAVIEGARWVLSHITITWG